MLKLLLALLNTLPPKPAIWVASLLHGRPDIAPALVRVCARESNCSRIGVHAIDAIPSRSSYHGQIKLGDRAREQGKDTHLDRRCQPKGNWKRWGTRGILGFNAADAWPYLWRCYAPEVLDIPLVSAHVGVKFYLEHCDDTRERGWCPRPNSSS